MTTAAPKVKIKSCTSAKDHLFALMANIINQ